VGVGGGEDGAGVGGAVAQERGKCRRWGGEGVDKVVGRLCRIISRGGWVVGAGGVVEAGRWDCEGGARGACWVGVWGGGGWGGGYRAEPWVCREGMSGSGGRGTAWVGMECGQASGVSDDNFEVGGGTGGGGGVGGGARRRGGGDWDGRVGSEGWGGGGGGARVEGAGGGKRGVGGWVGQGGWWGGGGGEGGGVGGAGWEGRGWCNKDGGWGVG